MKRHSPRTMRLRRFLRPKKLRGSPLRSNAFLRQGTCVRRLPLPTCSLLQAGHRAMYGGFWQGFTSMPKRGRMPRVRLDCTLQTRRIALAFSCVRAPYSCSAVGAMRSKMHAVHSPPAHSHVGSRCSRTTSSRASAAVWVRLKKLCARRKRRLMSPIRSKTRRHHGATTSSPCTMSSASRSSCSMRHDAMGSFSRACRA